MYLYAHGSGFAARRAETIRFHRSSLRCTPPRVSSKRAVRVGQCPRPEAKKAGCEGRFLTMRASNLQRGGTRRFDDDTTQEANIKRRLAAPAKKPECFQNDSFGRSGPRPGRALHLDVVDRSGAARVSGCVRLVAPAGPGRGTAPRPHAIGIVVRRTVRIWRLAGSVPQHQPELHTPTDTADGGKENETFHHRLASRCASDFSSSASSRTRSYGNRGCSLLVRPVPPGSRRSARRRSCTAAPP